jgi:hypothetical protein
MGPSELTTGEAAELPVAQESAAGKSDALALGFAFGAASANIH